MRSLRAVSLLAVAVAMAAAPALAGCGSDRVGRGEQTVRVVATHALLADLVRNAGGRRVRVTALVPRQADLHSWRPGPLAREAIAAADLVVRSGGTLDAWLPALAEQAGGARVLTLRESLDPLGTDPHWWQDPVRVQRAIKLIRNELARVDTHGAGYYEAASGDYLGRLRRLDRQTRECLAPIDRGRQLVTDHDAFAHFSDRYGVEIASAAATRSRRGRGESARRAARVGRRLWGDNLARRGSPADSYLGAIASNVATIVDGLSGGRRRCRPAP